MVDRVSEGKTKQKMGNPPVEARGQKVQKSSKDNSMGKVKGQNSSVNKSKGKR